MTQHSQNGEGVELLPCPFCGGSARVEIGMVAFEDAEIHCQKCACTGPNFDDGPTKDNNRRLAIAAWNTRQPLAREPATADVGREAVRAVTAEMRRFMPNACGDWADKIDAAMLTETARKVAFYDEPGHDVRPGETLPDRDRRIYQQGRHDALNDEPEAFI